VCTLDSESGTNHCVPAAAEGDLCTQDIDCGPGLGCAESTCMPLRADLCVSSESAPSSVYPARLPSVPQGVSGFRPTTLSAPRIVLVSFPGDARADTLEPFVAALGASSYWQSATSEYGVGALEVLPPIRLKQKPPADVKDADIHAWLDDKLANDARFPSNDGSTVYALLYPRNVRVSYPISETEDMHSCVDFGGYHSSFSGADGTVTPYAVIPDCYYANVTTAVAHELVEAATDPYVGQGTLGSIGYYTVDASHYGWAVVAGGGELADLCDWQPLSSYRDPELMATVERSWSNAAMAGFHQPCVPARSTAAYFNSVPRLDNPVVLHDPTGSRRPRGVSIAVGDSRTIPVDLLSDAPTEGPWRVSAYDLDQWHSRGHTDPMLRFAFDKQSGVNGDVLQMTITVLKQDPTYLAEPFVIVSRRGHEVNTWVGVVGQPSP
jgi:hypothetical protein